MMNTDAKKGMLTKPPKRPKPPKPPKFRGDVSVPADKKSPIPRPTSATTTPKRPAMSGAGKGKAAMGNVFKGLGNKFNVGGSVTSAKRMTATPTGPSVTPPMRELRPGDMPPPRTATQTAPRFGTLTGPVTPSTPGKPTPRPRTATPTGPSVEVTNLRDTAPMPELRPPMGAAKGGMASKKGYAKGGMANCGASMKPAQKGK